MSRHNHPADAPGSARWDADTINNITQTIALMAAGAWAVYTFIYQQQIAPALAPPTLTLTSTLEKAGQRGDLTAIRCAVTRTNVGQSGVRVLGITYNLTGIKERFLAGGAVNLAFTNPLTDVGKVNRTLYQGEPERQEVIQKIGTLFAGAHAQGIPSELNPEESISRDMVVYADRSKFDRVQMHVSLVYVSLSDPAPPLMLETNEQGFLSANLAPVCQNRKASCTSIYSTDFSTELSLWD